MRSRLTLFRCINVIGGTTSTTPKSSTPTNGITTPGPIQTGMTSQCNTFYLVQSGDQCGNIASAYGITLANFYLWNPAVGNTCASLIAGDYVCINIIGGTTLTSKTSTPTNGITTPTPIQTGMTSSCNTFYLVQPGDQCGTIASTHGISLSNFYLWNPAVGGSCATLFAGDYVCINVIGGPTITATPTPTGGGNGVATPTPYQAGMTSNCKTFHLVGSGDQCGTVASNAGITLATFYAWNPAVGSSCQFLDLGYYVCIAIL
jgi:LysM domain